MDKFHSFIIPGFQTQICAFDINTGVWFCLTHNQKPKDIWCHHDRTRYTV